MNKGLLACFALAFFCTPGEASAQFNDARAYDNTPVGVSQFELSYTYVRSNASLDPSLAIAGANLNLNKERSVTRTTSVFFVAWLGLRLLCHLQASMVRSQARTSTVPSLVLEILATSSAFC
jgi:hypothetical protein